ncbi:hypothetical protein AD940_09040, partial [Gluconobacter thailandicus]|uniref:hypothetical protein n=1 Tax=Gluconobacter thailandicus TaxID=257438 RepID=UPI00079C8272
KSYFCQSSASFHELPQSCYRKTLDQIFLKILPIEACLACAQMKAEAAKNVGQKALASSRTGYKSVNPDFSESLSDSHTSVLREVVFARDSIIQLILHPVRQAAPLENEYTHCGARFFKSLMRCAL